MHAILKRKKMPLFILFSIMKSIAILDIYCICRQHCIQFSRDRFGFYAEYEIFQGTVFTSGNFSRLQYVFHQFHVLYLKSLRMYLPRGSVRNDGNGCLCWSSCCYGSAYLTLPFSRQDPAPPQTCWLPGGRYSHS